MPSFRDHLAHRPVGHARAPRGLLAAAALAEQEADVALTELHLGGRQRQARRAVADGRQRRGPGRGGRARRRGPPQTGAACEQIAGPRQPRRHVLGGDDARDAQNRGRRHFGRVRVVAVEHHLGERVALHGLRADAERRHLTAAEREQHQIRRQQLAPQRRIARGDDGDRQLAAHLQRRRQRDRPPLVVVDDQRARDLRRRIGRSGHLPVAIVLWLENLVCRRAHRPSA